MAKFGEGDARWLVQDLGEGGRNVGNWHWVETDALPWAKARFSELLVGLELSAPGAAERITVTKLESLTGDAVVNNRKGKVIAAYELDGTLVWEARPRDEAAATVAEGSDGAAVPEPVASGKIRFPYISEENADEDPEVTVSTTKDDDVGRRARQAVVDNRRALWDRASIFVRELCAGGPRLSAKAGGEGKGAEGSAATAAAAAPATAAEDAEAARPAAAALAAPTAATSATAGSASRQGSGARSSVPGAGRTLELSETFFAGARELYDCFADPRKVAAYTGGNAIVEPRPGGKLSLFGGSVTGEFVTLEEPSRLVMKWRFSTWEDDAQSLVELRIDERSKGDTHVTLTQTGVPDVDRYGQHDVLNIARAGWKDQVFGRIRRVFGYGV